MYKIIACDLDGTLIDSQNRLSAENIEAIKKLNEKGVLFVPTTGRTLAEMSEVAELDSIRYILFSTGTGIMDKDADTIDVMGIDNHNVCRIADVISKCDVYPILHYQGKTIADAGKNEMLRKFEKGLQFLVDNYAVFMDDFINETKKMDNMESFCLFFTDKEETKKCRALLEEIPGICVTGGAWGVDLEVSAQGGGKDKGLKRLVEKLGLDMADVMTVGDSNNDVSMTKIAGKSLAVSNACDALKDIADEIICSNNQHVAQYIYNKFYKA